MRSTRTPWESPRPPEFPAGSHSHGLILAIHLLSPVQFRDYLTIPHRLQSIPVPCDTSVKHHTLTHTHIHKHSGIPLNQKVLHSSGCLSRLQAVPSCIPFIHHPRLLCTPSSFITTFLREVNPGSLIKQPSHSSHYFPTAEYQPYLRQGLISSPMQIVRIFPWRNSSAHTTNIKKHSPCYWQFTGSWTVVPVLIVESRKIYQGMEGLIIWFTFRSHALSILMFFCRSDLSLPAVPTCLLPTALCVGGPPWSLWTPIHEGALMGLIWWIFEWNHLSTFFLLIFILHFIGLSF